MFQSPGSKVDNQALARSFQGMLMPKSIVAGALITSYLFLINAASIPSKLLLRKNMGERIFSPFAFLLMLIALLCVIFLGLALGSLNVMDDLMKIQSSGLSYFFEVLLLIVINPFTYFIYLIVGKGISHFKQVIRKARNSEYSYSYYRGDSLYFQNRRRKIFGFELTDTTRQMLLEPWKIFKISLLVYIISLSLTIYIYNNRIDISFIHFLYSFLVGLVSVGFTMMISSICLFLDELGIVMKNRSELLDAFDGEIYARQIAEERDKAFRKKSTDTNDEDSVIL